jgi:hypothetical protein
MPFSESVKVMLYACSGNRCAYPRCGTRLVFTLHGSTVVNHGKAAHIVAESPHGPRGKSKLSAKERNSYENGVVFCSNHHNDVVDKFPAKFPIETLRKWKKQHEEIFGKPSGATSKKIQILTMYADCIDKWNQMAALDRWEVWTHPLLRGGSQCISESAFYNLQELCKWLGNRIWPRKLLLLENSLENFSLVANDFAAVFDKHSDLNGRMICTDKYYRRRAQRETALAEFKFHTTLVEDLVLELTRAANLVCQRVRETFDANFRLDEGRLVAKSGPYTDGSNHLHLAEYRSRELKKKYPYPGLESFLKIRTFRDTHFGEGMRQGYIESLKGVDG